MLYLLIGDNIAPCKCTIDILAHLLGLKYEENEDNLSEDTIKRIIAWANIAKNGDLLQLDQNNYFIIAINATKTRRSLLKVQTVVQ
jgi:hypothetical protein